MQEVSLLELQVLQFSVQGQGGTDVDCPEACSASDTLHCKEGQWGSLDFFLRDSWRLCKMAESVGGAISLSEGL